MVKRILDLIGWLGTALVFIGAAIRLGFPAREQYVPYLIVAGLVCVAAYAAGHWRDIASVFVRRQARYGTLAGVSFLAFVGLLIVINYIGAVQKKRWDLTTNQAFSLSDQTKNVLAKLDAPLQVTVFAKQPDFPQFQDTMQEYEYASKRVSTQYIDPDKQPTLAKQNQITQYGTIVLNYKGRTERVTSTTEQDITTGIIKVVTGQTKTVYFTQGHGERDTTSSDRDGYSTIAAALGSENYKVDKLVLAQAGAVPDDASVVVVAGPKIDFFPPEIDALKKYLDRGGKLLLELDPPDRADSPPLTNLIGLAHDWGMTVGDDLVLDASGMGRLLGAGPESPVAASYPPHAITERFNLLTLFPLARSVDPVMNGVNGHIAQPIVNTGPQSFAKADVKALLSGKGAQQVSIDESKGDRKGPITIAAAASASVTTSAPAKDAATPAADAPKPEIRVVVFGDSDFAANFALGVQGNRDLFMNTIGWLSQQENLISIRPKQPDDRRLTMTATQQSNLVWLSLLVVPACIFGTGFFTWWRRR